MSSSGGELQPFYNLAKIGGSDPFGTALAAATNYGGGTIYVPTGTFQIGTYNITVPVKVLGDSYGSSVLQVGAGVNADAITVSRQQVIFEHVGLDGNKAAQTAGRILVYSAAAAANYLRLLDCWIKNSFGDSVVLQGPGASLTGMIARCHIDQAGGVALNLAAGSASDCEIDHCVFSNSGSHGISCNAGDVMFTQCHSWGNTGSGLFMPSGAGGGINVVGGAYETNQVDGIQPRGRGNTIVGARVYKNRNNGIYAFSNTNLAISGGQYYDNGQSAAGGIGNAGIQFDTCTASSVTGASMFDDQGVKTQTYGYAENANTCNACVITGNATRAADHKTGSVLVGTGNPTATIQTGNVV